MPGPFYFAWVDAGTPFDPDAHARWDDDIFEFALEHNEGDFATLRLVVRNPRIGLLAPGRKRWCFFSWDNGTEIVPLFHGRIVGIPEQLQNEIVELNFIARPADYDDQRAAVADELRTYGYWDPIWFSPDDVDDPDNVLESRPALWHIDRVTLEVTISDILQGEDGTLVFPADIVPYDSVSVTYDQNPISRVVMTATVSWDQKAAGTLDISRIRPSGLTSRPGTIMSRTGEGLTQDWPKSGSSIGGGWSWAAASVNIVSGPINQATVGDWSVDGAGNSFYLDGGFDTSLGQFGVQLPGQPIGWAYHVVIPLWEFTYTLVLGYNVSRRRGETLTFALDADVQPTLSDPDDASQLLLTMQSSEVVDSGAIPANGATFFTTSRGVQSIEYLIAVARAHLIARSRAVNVGLQIPFPDAVAFGLSCRKSGILVDPRLPGGTATGKIKSYSLSLQDGKQIADITLGCAVGRGGTVTPVLGDPDYVEDDYVETDWQFHPGSFVVPTVGDVSYQSIEGAPFNDDGVNFNSMTAQKAIKEFAIVDNFDGSQEDALSLFTINVDERGSVDATNTTYAKMHLRLINLQSSFTTTFNMPVSQLKIPKLIDLEAA